MRWPPRLRNPLLLITVVGLVGPIAASLGPDGAPSGPCGAPSGPFGAPSGALGPAALPFVLFGARAAKADSGQGAATALPRAEPGGAAAGLGALVAAGRDAEALAVLDAQRRRGREPPPRRYLRGRLLERLGRYEEAAASFGAAAEAEPLPRELRDDASERRALSLSRAGKCSEARAHLEPLAARRGSQGALFRAVLAECALALGELPRAAEALRAVVAEAAGPVDVFAARLQLAEALAGLGDRDGAVAQLRAALRDRAGHPEQSQARAGLDALGAALDEDIPEVPERTDAQRMAAAQGLLAREPAAALAELAEVATPSDARGRAQLLHLRGMALYGMRTRYGEAAEVLAQAARLGGPHAIDDEFHAARARSRAGDNRAGIAGYRRLVRAHRTHPRAAEAAYLSAWLQLREGGPTAHRELERFVQGPYAQRRPEDAAAAKWLLGFHYFEKGNQRLARRYLEEYRGVARSALEQARAMYWIGRSHQAQGQREAAITAYLEALHHEPLHWYAQLAQRRLAELGRAEVDPFPGGAATGEPPAAPPAFEVELPPAVRILHALGFPDEALALLSGSERAVQAAAPRGRGLEALLAAYGSVGEATRPFRLAAVAGGRFTTRPPGNAHLWQAAYPRPHVEVVRDAATRLGVPEDYVYATMRQESAYDPRVVSPAGAVGLMQVMPRTAERIVQNMGVPFERSMLFDPTWNVRIGIAEMSELSGQWNGQLPLMAAAYNAGAHRVRQWLAETGPIEFDRFVERIPFNETRNYVRRVVSHYARYQYLRDPAAAFDVPIPERVQPGS